MPRKSETDFPKTKLKKTPNYGPIRMRTITRGRTKKQQKAWASFQKGMAKLGYKVSEVVRAS